MTIQVDGPTEAPTTTKTTEVARISLGDHSPYAMQHVFMSLNTIVEGHPFPSNSNNPHWRIESHNSLYKYNEPPTHVVLFLDETVVEEA
jgi:hypothetical protein